jgi:hypothetical protein
VFIFSKTFCENSKIRRKKNGHYSLDDCVNVAVKHKPKSVVCPENK